MSKRTRGWLIIAVVAIAAMVPVVAIASDPFSDVPDSNIFHDDIGWLADVGVTLGCNPPANTEFCPGEYVKRQQMAAFMHRFAQNLSPRAAFNFDEVRTDIAAAYLHVEIEAPARGVLVMNAAAHIELTTADTADSVVCELEVDGKPVPGTSMYASVGNNDGGAIGDSTDNICSATGAMVVDPGNHTVSFSAISETNLDDPDADSPVVIRDRSVNVIWVPADGSGNIPVLTPDSTVGGTGEE